MEKMYFQEERHEAPIKSEYPDPLLIFEDVSIKRDEIDSEENHVQSDLKVPKVINIIALLITSYLLKKLYFQNGRLHKRDSVVIIRKLLKQKVEVEGNQIQSSPQQLEVIYSNYARYT